MDGDAQLVAQLRDLIASQEDPPVGSSRIDTKPIDRSDHARHAGTEFSRYARRRPEVTVHIVSIPILERTASDPAAPPYFESLRPFYTHAAHAEVTDVVRLDPWSPLEGMTELVRIRFAHSGHDPQLRVRETPLLHVGCGPLPRGVQYAGATEMIEDVRRVIADLAELRPNQ